ncbi:MAG: RdgB/HAM1 family non-canonical purine NTP pyrophosphatase [Anaerolineales bacterium]|jgi:XTP/dITP diphosphohydrolase|nr:RdgB/HAM1 family non-canonical purine NTP pyrophosphatase [Anaerolineales bacterium]MDP7259336.1 RdgB/HAM1 family non-canonical purine NTP pyrophosphatase [Anaerolineales bacterium]HJO33292.1 RdgB/HAM1 family non-canonical purine NTP pyrophosphatase [Anaerolineales bacterium]
MAEDVLEIVLATRNRHKLLEFKRLLTRLRVRWLRLTDLRIDAEVAENGITFAANAACKAREYCHLSGLPTLADDSGLTVDALGGRPGVHSARYAGPGATQAEQWQQLLREMQAAPWEQRNAQFHCALALARPDHPELLTAEGDCAGMIALQPRGAGGFGYDPLFYLPERGVTMAELTPEQKDRISHRGRAARAIAPQIAALLAQENGCGGLIIS